MHHSNLVPSIARVAGSINDQQLDFSSSWDVSKLKEIIRDEGLLMQVERGKLLFRQGKPVDKIFLIENGCVAFSRSCAEGNRQILDYFFNDTIVSNMLEASEPATFSAQCLTDTSAYILSRASLQRIAAISPEIYHAGNALLQTLLSQAYDNLSNIGCRHGEERVSYILCKLYDGFNSHTSNGGSDITREIPIRQIDMADTIGVTPVYINQILKSLKQKGLIGINKGLIEIIDIKKLKRLC